jgi:hypothetical protein
LAGPIGLARQGCLGAGEAVRRAHAGGVPGIVACPDTMARLSAALTDEAGLKRRPRLC